MTLSEELIDDDFDQKNARSFEWTADNKLRRFRIIRNDGTVKEILFSDIVADRKLRKLFESYVKEVEDMNDNDRGVCYTPTLFKLQQLLEDSKK